jgi:methyltransferase (TIGR00027 family)
VEPDRFSRTAILTACIRAFHAAHDDPKVFDDFLAHHLVTSEECQSLGIRLSDLSPPAAAMPRTSRTAALPWWIKAIAGSILARARYFEESLEQAIRRGIEQYVILGAGMDTFAFRRPELLRRLPVFEIDHPATQTFKRRRLAEVGLKPPDTLHFIPLDFAKESLAEALKRSAYDHKASAFFSWPGVIAYLRRRDVMSTFRAIADIAPPGSNIVFDYLEEPFFDPDNPHRSVNIVHENLRLAGEPMITGFDPAGLASELSHLGFRIREDMSADEVERVFLRGAAGYHAGLYTHLARAEVEGSPS